MKAQELVNKSLALIGEIEKYILSVPNWLFYWIPPTLKEDSKNQLIKDFIIEHPDDWEENVSLKVCDVGGISVKVQIHIMMDDEDRLFERYLVLPHFAMDVEYNKKAMDGQLNDIRIKELNDEIAYHKKQLKLAEEELNKLRESMN